MVNQWQLLALAGSSHPLRHRDVPFFRPHWSAEKNSGGFTPEQNAAIAGIPAPLPGEPFDVTYRISFPYNVGPAGSGRLFVFGTAEAELTDRMLANGDLRGAARDDGLVIVTPSQWSRGGFLRAGFDGARVLVIPHGVDPRTFYPVDAEERLRFRDLLKLKATDFALLTLGAMTPNKGIDLLIVAYATLKQRYGNLRLLLKDQRNLYGIDAQRYFGEVRHSKHGHLLTESAIADVVFIPQNLNLGQLRRLYGASDCYVAPYRAEGFNLPPLEAAACGVPVVLTKGGSTDDYFRPLMGSQIEAKLNAAGELRFLEPDLDSLIAGLAAIIEGTIACGGAPASRHVHEHFSWARVTGQLLSAFGE
jgi:glycosyltransferase involved in cell wall biosynthesis